MVNPRVPTAKLKLAGTYREDRHGGRGDQVYTVGKPAKPEWLDSEAGELWDTLMETLHADILAAADEPTLAGMCRWFAIWRRLDAQVEKSPKTIRRLLFVQAKQAWAEFAKSASRFGMTPVDRAKLQTETRKERDSLSEFFDEKQTGAG